MAIFSQVVATAPLAYPSSPQVTIPFTPKRIVVVNQNVAAADVAQVSFDGVSDAFTLKPTVNATMEVRQRSTKLWVKGTNTPNVMVFAEDTAES